MQIRLGAAALLLAAPALAQTPTDPFPAPIEAREGVVRVNYRDFASIPDIDGQPARMMTLVDEPGTRRLFLSDMRGPIYSISYDGRSVARYIDVNDPRWGTPVQSGGRERGVQSFAFHPQFNQPGTAGFGKFYTWMDTQDNQKTPDYRPGGGTNTHHTVLLEWTAVNPTGPAYDGVAPREVLRLEQPYANHNGGHLAFRPGARPGDGDFGLLYVGVADGGSGGDPLELAQNLSSPFGKILRLDPLARTASSGRYGVPADNPFVGRSDVRALPEIYAYGVRNPQRFGWDPSTGRMFVADIGQNVVETLSLVTPGANLGWNDWEGSFAYVNREVRLSNPRSDPAITYPVAEYDQTDPLLQNSSAVTGVHVYRDGPIAQLRNRVLFGDFPSGEIFHIDADNLPSGGQQAIRRVLFNDGGTTRTLLQLIQERNRQQGRTPATRADLRFGAGPDGQVLILNKADGTVRLLVP